MKFTTSQRAAPKTKHVCQGGPYSGENIWLTKEAPRESMVFTARGMRGKYVVPQENRAAMWSPC
jgi:hypothetical protein